MKKQLQKKVREFVEAEQKAQVDQKLLEKLHETLLQNTLYWQWTPEQRNAFNSFFKDVSDEFTRATLEGEYGAQVILESLFVTMWESGYRVGLSGDLTQTKEEK